MGGRYWITGVQVGLIRAMIGHDTNYITGKKQLKEIDKILDEIFDKQFISDFPTEKDKKRFTKKYTKAKHSSARQGRTWQQCPVHYA